MPQVFYKFKSAKDFDFVTFDGTGISVFDLKREIIIAKKLGKGVDFDLEICHAQTMESMNLPCLIHPLISSPSSLFDIVSF